MAKEVSKMKEGEVRRKRKMIMIMHSSWSTSQWDFSLGKAHSHHSLVPRPPTRPGYEATHTGNMAAWLNNCEIKIGLNAAGL